MQACAERVAKIARDPERMRGVANEVLQRMVERVNAAELTADDRDHCLSLLHTGGDALMLAGIESDNERERVFLIGCAFGAAIAVSEVLDGDDDTELHASMRAVSKALNERGSHVH